MAVRRALIFAGTLAILALMGCNSILGHVPGEYVRGDDDASATAGLTCGLSLGADSCSTCVAAACCASARGCARDAACGSFEQCLFACGKDYDCRAACVSVLHHHVAVEVPPFEQCVAANCTDACHLPCSMLDSFGLPDSGTACMACIAAEACDPVRACEASLPCGSTALCHGNCRTPDCQQACLDADDAGGGLLTAVLTAVAKNCITACSAGQSWDCVGSVAWPAPESSTLELKLSVYAEGPVPVPNVRVDECDFGGDCSLASGTTNPQGIVVLNVPARMGYGFAWGFEGYFQLQGEAIYPELFFLGFPVTEPHASLFLGVADRNEFDSVSRLAGIALDPARGHMIVQAEDCNLIPAPGVIFTAPAFDAQTRIRYVADSLLSEAATSTDASGVAFVFNVPTDASFTIEARPAGLGRPSGHATLFARPGTISVVNLVPTP
jgi:hypothetical protein